MIRPHYYTDTVCSLYKVANKRKWDSYTFDVAKRLERAAKKGCFKIDIEKTITVIELCKQEHKRSFVSKIVNLFRTNINQVAKQRRWNNYVCVIVQCMEFGEYDNAIEICRIYWETKD